jgi:two-component system, cell cycle sensor histidine kinase and response regulator CckA
MRCVLLVCSDETLCRGFKKALENETPEYQIEISSSAEQALNKLKTDGIAFDVLVSDYRLPKMTGIEFFHQLKDYDYEFPRVIMLDIDILYKAREALEAGAIDYLLKDGGNGFMDQLPIFLQKIVSVCNHCIPIQKAKAALKESEDNFYNVFLMVPYSLLISSFDEGRIMEINECGTQLFGRTHDEMVGKTAIELGIITPENRNTLVEEIKTRGYFDNVEIELTLYSGEKRTCLVSGRRITLRGAECIIYAANDISLLKKMEYESLRSKNLQSIGALAGGIARDFNCFMTSILGNISLAKLSMHDAEKIHRALTRAEEISLKATELANKLLTFSEGGEPIYKEFSIIASIENNLEMNFSRISTAVDIQKDNKLWTVVGDEAQLDQVIYNILLNAVESLQENGKINIETRNISLPDDNDMGLKEGKYVSVTIGDNGVGITAEDLARIFDPFFSTKDGDTASRHGLGLGLTICRSIVLKHNGYISIESTVGKGTTVVIYLPVYVGDNPIVREKYFETG